MSGICRGRRARNLLCLRFRLGVSPVVAVIDQPLIEHPIPNRLASSGHSSSQQAVCMATWKREFKLPWREAGPPNHHDDKVVSGQ